MDCGVRTDDVALAAYLRMKSHTPLSVEWNEEEVCYWEYDTHAIADAQDFLEDYARVNPKDFTKAYGEAKREMRRAKEKAERSTMPRPPINF
jgi:hypothetical protein